MSLAPGPTTATDINQGLISYSEATRFTPQKYLETVQWCKSRGKPVPQYTLWPRKRGFVASVKALRESSSIGAVYDLTIAYAHEGRFHEAPTFTQSLFEPNLGESFLFHVHAERFDIRDLAYMNDNQLATWLEQRWKAKSSKLQDLQQLLEDGRDWSNKTPHMLNGNVPSRAHYD